MKEYYIGTYKKIGVDEKWEIDTHLQRNNPKEKNYIKNSIAILELAKFYSKTII